MGSTPRIRAFLAWLASAVVVVALVVSACSGSRPEIEYGAGKVPPAIPDDFPMPAGAVIGETVIDRVQTETRAEISVSQGVEDLARFFGVALVNSGYVIDSSTGDVSRWIVAFHRGPLEGTIEFRPSGEAGSVVSILVNDT